jgi:hypothetical protein
MIASLPSGGIAGTDIPQAFVAQSDNGYFFVPSPFIGSRDWAGLSGLKKYSDKQIWRT